MPVYNKSDSVMSGNVNLPRDRYTLRGVEAGFAPSKSSGNPMVTLQCEVLGRNGEEVIEDIQGQKIQIAGMKVIYYIVFSEKAIGGAFDVLKKLGYEQDSIDTDNFDASWLKGVVFDSILSSTLEPKRKQAKPGEKVGEPILDAEGKQIMQYKINASTQEILGVNSQLQSRAF